MKDSLLIQPQSGVGSRHTGLEAKRALSIDKESERNGYEKDSSGFSEKFQDSSKKKISSTDKKTKSSSDLETKPESDNIQESLTAIDLLQASESETHALGETLIIGTDKQETDSHAFLTIKGDLENIDVLANGTLTDIETALNENAQDEILLREITTDIIQITEGGESQANAAQMVQAIAANENTGENSDYIEGSDVTIDLLSSSDLRDIDIDSVDVDTSNSEPDLLRRETLNTPTLINSGLSLGEGQVFPNATLSNGTPLFGLGIESQSPVILSGQSLTGSNTATTAPTVANAITNTVAQAILTAKETPQGVMVQLDPPEMGRVYIDFMFDGDNAVTVVVKADSAESHAILRERSEQFMQMLAEKGFENVNLSFEQQSSQQDDGSQEAFENGRHLDIQTDQQINDIVTSYENPIYRVNEDQLRLDLKI